MYTYCQFGGCLVSCCWYLLLPLQYKKGFVFLLLEIYSKRLQLNLYEMVKELKGEKEEIGETKKYRERDRERETER